MAKHPKMRRAVLSAAAVAAISNLPALAVAGGIYLVSTAAKVASRLAEVVMGPKDAPRGIVFGANAFSKEERVAFEDAILGFEDDCTLSGEVEIYRTSAQEMERSNNTIWVPQPYIAASYDGLDQSSNFKDITQLAVPLSLGFSKSVPWTMSATDLNDAIQNDTFGVAARQKLASDINLACSNVACLQGTQVVKRTTAPTGYDDISLCDSLLTEQGVQRADRKMVLHTRHYNSMASNLAARGTMAGKPTAAYETSLVGMVAGFKTYEAGYTYSLAAAAGVSVTVNGANQRYVPKATSTAGTGETSNVDNRYQNLAVTVSSGTIKVGDCFTIAGVNAVHMITKASTGQPKTFRVTAIISGGGGTGTIQISPPIIAADSSPTPAESFYKNCTATPANGAQITWLNTVTGNVAPFWVKGAMKLLPGRYSPQENAGLAVMRATTKQGIEVLMTKQGAIGDLSAKYRMDVRFGVSCAAPDQCGIELFSQS